MNKKSLRFFTMLMACIMLLGAMGNAFADTKPDTWIADRTIRVQAYVDDIGYQLPKDQLNTPVMQELARRTGMKIEFLYTPGEKDRYVMNAQLASGDMNGIDMICSYLNNSTRPEFPILLKAAKDGMFVDLAPYIKDTKVYSKYMDKDYLPADTYNNIVWRKDFNGAAYFMHLEISAVDDSTVWNPDKEYVGGMYIQKAIAEDLGVDTRSINSTEQLYDLLKKISEKGYKDVNGNPIVPLGPKYWGGSPDALDFVVNDLTWGVSGDFNLTEDGKVLHEAETDWVYKKVDYIRKLLNEGLMHKEFFTMDETRSKELCQNKGVAVIGDIHSYVDIITESDTWIPLGPIANYRGGLEKITSGKGGYGQWAIPEGVKNPEEIVKLMDYLSTYEGQLLCLYGVEGLTYDMKDGKPVLKPEVLKAIEENDTAAMYDTYGAAFNNAGVYGLSYILTDRQNEAYFGETRPGAGGGNLFERAVQIAKDYPRVYKLVPGLKASAFMSELEDVNAAMNLLNYDEVIGQACFAADEAKVKEIIENFRAQLKSAGIEKFEELVLQKHTENPDTVIFY